MLERFTFVAFLFIASLPLYSQQKFHQVIEEGDTTIYNLKYHSLDSLEKGELSAYFKENSDQVAIYKKYYLGKQSGVTKTYFPNGTVYEVIVYQNGM